MSELDSESGRGSAFFFPRSAVLFPSDGAEMDDGKRLILMAWTSVSLTNGSPKLGKPLARPGREWSWSRPRCFPWLSIQSAGLESRPRHGGGCSHLPSIPPLGLACHQPARWHRASLMNKACIETWRAPRVFSFKCYDSCHWPKTAGDEKWKLWLAWGIYRPAATVYHLWCHHSGLNKAELRLWNRVVRDKSNGFISKCSPLSPRLCLLLDLCQPGNASIFTGNGNEKHVFLFERLLQNQVRG